LNTSSIGTEAQVSFQARPIGGKSAAEKWEKGASVIFHSSNFISNSTISTGRKLLTWLKTRYIFTYAIHKGQILKSA
jgi:hypothetical protein